MLLIGNKLDRADKREARACCFAHNIVVQPALCVQVSKERGLSLAQQHGMMFMECSAKSNVGIHRAFEELAEKISERQPTTGTSNTGLNVGAAHDSASSVGCYC